MLRISITQYKMLLALGLGCLSMDGLLRSMAGLPGALFGYIFLVPLLFVLPERQATLGRTNVPKAIVTGQVMAVTAIFILFVVMVAQIFNENVFSKMTAMRAIRISTFPLFFAIIGIRVASIPGLAVFLYARLLPLLGAINIMAAVTQYAIPGSFLGSLVKAQDWTASDTLGSIRLTGLLYDPQPLVMYAAYLTCFSFYRIVNTTYTGPKSRALFVHLAGLSVGALGLGIGLSRASVALTGLIIGLFMLSRPARKIGRISIIVMIMVGGLIGAANYLRISDPIAYAYAVERYVKIVDPGSDRSFRVGRVDRWFTQAIPAIREYPAGLGLGGAGARRQWVDTGYQRLPILTESLYFGFMLEMGWAAGLIFVGLVGFGVWQSLGALLSQAQHRLPAREAATFFLLFAATGLFGPTLSSTPFSLISWMSFGLLTTLCWVQKRPASTALRLP